MVTEMGQRPLDHPETTHRQAVWFHKKPSASPERFYFQRNKILQTLNRLELK